VKRGIENKEGLDRIGKRIIDIDKDVQKSKEYIRTHPVLSETVLKESVQGFIDFVEKFQEIPK